VSGRSGSGAAPRRGRLERRARAWRRAATAALLLAAAGLAALGAVSNRTGAASRRAPYAADFPEGPGRAIAERACLFCHSAMLVTQQAKDSAGWERSIVQMEKWGTPLTPTEHDTLRGYLLASFGPRAPAK
jgi:cytochrome c5